MTATTTYKFDCGTILSEDQKNQLLKRVKNYHRGIFLLSETLSLISEDFRVDLETASKMFDEIGHWMATL